MPDIPAQPADSRREIRTDIQALRGFAVLIVLLYHARLGLFSAGYLGVDVFFVISGYLITRLVTSALDAGTFRFRDFYFRRAKRLLPAAYATFLATALLAPFLLTSTELADLRAQLLGALTFTANFVLWGQSGYFAGPADLKPLLHVWSLSIEEQYYLLLPASLVFVPKRFRLPGAILLAAASFALCAAHAADHNAAFYLLPWRAWELGIGCVGALMTLGPRLKVFVKLAFWPALAALCLLPASPFGYHPGPQALALCSVTLFVILRNSQALSNSPFTRALGKLGDMSYSLYLVHWPLFAFLNNAWLGRSNAAAITRLRIGVAILSLACAAALYYGIERPIHRAQCKLSLRAAGFALAASVLVAAICNFATAPSKAAEAYTYLRRPLQGLDDACDFKESFQPIPACRNSAEPEMLFWGDSFTMHLIPGVVSTSPAPRLVQATKAVCMPILDLSPVPYPGDTKWPKGCLQFNDSVVEYLRGASSVRTVILSSPFGYAVESWSTLVKRDARDGSIHQAHPGIAEALPAMKHTIDVIRALGKKVVVVGPPPTGGIDMSICNERLDRRLLTLGAVPGCRIPARAYRAISSRVLEFLHALTRQAGVDVIDFDSYLCDSGSCQTRIGDTLLYRDRLHLSYGGSVALAKAVSLVSQIRQKAR